MYTLFNILAFSKRYLVSQSKLTSVVVKQYVNALVKRELRIGDPWMSNREVYASAIDTMSKEVAQVLVEGYRIPATDVDAASEAYKAFGLKLFELEMNKPEVHELTWDETFPVEETITQPVVEAPKAKAKRAKVSQPVLA